jgi:transposase
MEPGAVASEVAPAAGIHASQLFRWHLLCSPAPSVPAAAVFSPMAILPERGVAPALGMMRRAVEIEFASGARLRPMAPIDVGTLKPMIAALAKDRRRYLGSERRPGVVGERPLGHISWQEFEDNQKLLIEKNCVRKSARGGGVLLTGLMR